jgi:two-component system, cell cycle sensor histidine kinase and response regulator CckA
MAKIDEIKTTSEVSRSQLSPAVIIRRLVVGVLLINLFIATLTYLSLRQSRLQYEERAAVTTQNLAQVLDNHICGIIGKIDVLLFAAAEELESQFARGGVDRQLLETLLTRMVSQMPELDRLTVVNARSEITYGTGIGVGVLKNVSDREYFKHLRDNPGCGLYISKPLVSRIDGQWVLILARRISLADGSFAGTVAGVVSLKHFQKLFATIDVGPHGTIALRDGELGGIARFPEPKVSGSFVGQKKVSREFLELANKGRKNGTYKTTPPYDNTERLYTFRKLANYPLQIIVGLGTGDYLAQWRSEVAKMSAAASFFFLFTLFTALLIFRDWKRRMAAVRELILTRHCLDNAAIGIFNVSMDGTIMSVNDYACQSLGYSKEELGVMNILDIDPAINVEKASEIKRALDNFGHATHESIHRRKDGTTFPVEITTTIAQFNGKEYPFSFVKDITERRQAEQQIADSNKLNRRIIESVDEGVIVLGVDSCFQAWNPYMEKLTGLSLDEVLGKHPAKVFPLLHEAVITEKNKKTLAGQMPDQLDLPYHFPASGRSGWLWVTNSPLRNSKDEKIGAIVTVRDTTERKLAEQALYDTQFSVDHAAVPIFWIQEDRRFLYANEACSYLGYSRDELLKMTVYDIVPLYSKEEAAKILETLRQKGSMTFESIHKTKYGALVPVEVTLNDLKHAGKVFYVAYIRDISERKAAEVRIARSELKFRAIFESAHDAIFLISADSAYVDCNPAATELFRCAKEDILAGNPRYFSPPNQPGGFNSMDKIREIISDALQGNPQCFEWRHRRPDGSDFDSLVVLSRFELDGESMLVAIVRDISQRKSLEEQLRHAQKMEAVGQLASGVAHDFNNIISAIIGFTYLVSRKIPEDDPSGKYVEQISAAAKRAAELTRGLLSFSRKEVMTPKKVDVNDIVIRLEKMLRRLIRSNIELRVETSPVALNVIADRGKTEQVIMNLVTNARDSINDDGCITIKTSTFAMDNQFLRQHGFGKTGNYACITVSDTGSGMCEETKRKIFEPFFTTKKSGKGTGLGLSIAYGIIKQHNGNIIVSSEPNQGTKFSIYLPLSDIPSITGPPAQSAPPNILHGNETLLLADDDVTVNQLHKILLEEAGYKVISAAEGKEALNKFLEHEGEIALLILDTVMPKMSGKGMLEHIKKVNPEIKALFVSGYPAEVLRNADMVPEDAEVMFKPVSPNDLLCKIRELLDR